MNPKRHHFLPEFYLRTFSKDGFLWVYDRKENSYRRQQPKNTAVIGYYYATTNEDGERDYEIEKLLSECERRAKLVIQILESSQSITPQQRVDLAFYLVLQHTRTPRFERETEEMADAFHKIVLKEMVPSVEAAESVFGCNKKNDGATAEDMYKFIHEEQFTVKGNRNNTISLMLNLARRGSVDIALMDWVVVHAAKGCSFITTDSPIGYVVPDEFIRSGEPVIGLGSDKITKLFPLTRKVALLIGKYGAGFGHFGFNRMQVRDFNVTVAQEAERFLIGPDEYLVRSVVRRSKIDKSMPATRMKVENVPHPSDPLRSYLVTRRIAADAPEMPLKFSERPEWNPNSRQDVSDGPPETSGR